MNATTRRLAAVGESTTTAYGRIHLQAQLTVEGGVTLTVWQGPSRHDAVTFSYLDPRAARRAYATIRQLAVAGSSAEQIAQAMGSDREHALGQVRQILDDALATATADDSTASAPLMAALQATKADTESAEETARLDRLAADINDHLRNVYGACLADTDEDTEPRAEVRTLEQIRAERAARAAHPSRQGAA